MLQEELDLLGISSGDVVVLARGTQEWRYRMKFRLYG